MLAGAETRALAHRAPASMVRHALRTVEAGTASGRSQPVAAVINAESSAPRMLAIAHELAQASSAELVLLLAAHGGSDPLLVPLVECWLGDRDATARVTMLADNNLARLTDVVARTGPRLLLWPGNGNTEMSSVAQPLLAAISCPLVVVR